MRKEGFPEEEAPVTGQYVSLPKCVPYDCPRVELDLLNQSASAICMMSLSEGWPDRVAPMMWDAHSAHLTPDGKQRLTGKIATALSSPAVIEFLRARAAKQNG